MEELPNCNYLFDDDSILIGWYPQGELHQILKTGCNCFVSLVTPDEVNALGEYANRIRELLPAAILMHYAINDRSIPSVDTSFKKFINAVVALKNCGYKIYLHCRGGHGRSGVVAGCILKTLGYPKDNILAMIQKALPFGEKTKST